MSRPSVEVTGTLHEDGTLTLDAKPELPAGRVRVVVRPEVQPEKEDWWACLQRIRAEREAAGCHFLDEAEMAARIADLRDEEDKVEQAYAEIEKWRREQGSS
jgi:hypothetical protein